jgi:hypothetical protein
MWTRHTYSPYGSVNATAAPPAQTSAYDRRRCPRCQEGGIRVMAIARMRWPPAKGHCLRLLYALKGCSETMRADRLLSTSEVMIGGQIQAHRGRQTS